MMHNDRHTTERILHLIQAERRGDQDGAHRIMQDLVDTRQDAWLLTMMLARHAGQLPHLVHHLLDANIRPNLTSVELPEHVAAVRLIVALANDDLDFANDLAMAQIDIGEDYARQVITTLLVFAAHQPQPREHTHTHSRSSNGHDLSADQFGAN